MDKIEFGILSAVADEIKREAITRLDQRGFYPDQIDHEMVLRECGRIIHELVGLVSGGE